MPSSVASGTHCTSISAHAHRSIVEESNLFPIIFQPLNPLYKVFFPVSFLCAFEKLRKANFNFAMSLRQSVCLSV